MSLELKQTKIFSPEYHFCFKDKYTLRVIQKLLNNHKEFMLDLAVIEPELHRRFIWAKKSLSSFILLAMISLYSVTPGNFFNTDFSHSFVWLVLLLSIISFVFVIIFSGYQKYFVSREAKVPLVVFYNNVPDKKTFNAFIYYLLQQSSQRFKKLNLSLQMIRAGELKTLRRLLDGRFISQQQYEQAKKKLLTMADG